jgi:hypothetical protein
MWTVVVLNTTRQSQLAGIVQSFYENEAFSWGCW